MHGWGRETMISYLSLSADIKMNNDNNKTSFLSTRGQRPMLTKLVVICGKLSILRYDT